MWQQMTSITYCVILSALVTCFGVSTFLHHELIPMGTKASSSSLGLCLQVGSAAFRLSVLRPTEHTATQPESKDRFLMSKTETQSFGKPQTKDVFCPSVRRIKCVEDQQ